MYNLENKLWAIDKSYVNKLASIKSQADDGSVIKTDGNIEKVDNFVVIPIRGVLTRYNFFAGTPIEMLDYQIRTALSNGQNIILDIDSPGGEVTGINALANLIYENNQNIKAYVSGTAASAAYWLASAASEVYADETADIGSVGVIAVYGKSDEDTIEVLSSNAKYKNASPETDEGRRLLQERVNDVEDVFIGSLAKFYGVDKQYVIDNFGNGNVFIASKAKERGMIDEIINIKDFGGIMATKKTQVKEDTIDYKAELEKAEKRIKELDEKLKAELEAKQEVTNEKIALENEKFETMVSSYTNKVTIEEDKEKVKGNLQALRSMYDENHNQFLSIADTMVSGYKVIKPSEKITELEKVEETKKQVSYEDVTKKFINSLNKK